MLPCGEKVREVGHPHQEHTPFARPPQAGEGNVCYRALGGKRNYPLFCYNGYCLSCFPTAWHLVTKEDLGPLAGCWNPAYINYDASTAVGHMHAPIFMSNVSRIKKWDAAPPSAILIALFLAPALLGCHHCFSQSTVKFWVILHLVCDIMELEKDVSGQSKLCRWPTEWKEHESKWGGSNENYLC